MNTVLALSLRPKTLDDLIGCDPIVQRIRKRAESGRLPHAWLFSGQTGSGKTTIARIIASSLQCTHKVPFGSCVKCYRRRKSRDIIELNMPDVRKEELEKILDGAWYNPHPGSKYRVYILDESHRMSQAAQDVLLKYTEDCPDSTVWISCTTTPDKLQRTLRRRHKIYSLPPLEIEDIRKLVKLGLKRIKSDLSSSDLVERLLEKNITSPALVMNAIENFAEGATAEESADVEGTSSVDTNAICAGVRKGEWADVSKILSLAKPEDSLAISSAMKNYMRGILVGEGLDSPQAKIAAKSILELNAVREDFSSVTACLFQICRRFPRNGNN